MKDELQKLIESTKSKTIEAEILRLNAEQKAIASELTDKLVKN